MTTTGPWNESPKLLEKLYPWEQIEGWRLLVQHLDLSTRFSLIVVFAPDEVAISLLRNQLEHHLGQAEAVLRIRFDPTADVASLSQSLLDLPTPSSETRVIWIDADPESPEQNASRDLSWSKSLARLNRHRNRLTSRFNCTLALALPIRLQQTLRTSAPDLWAIRSGVFRIEPPGISSENIKRLPEWELPSVAPLQSEDIGDPLVTLTEAQKLRGKSGREELLATLLLRAGRQARRQLDWQVAIASLEEAYTLAEHNSADPELRWDISIELSQALSDIADFTRAEFYLTRAVQISEQYFGKAHWRTALSLNDYSCLLKETNRLVEAELLMRRVLAIDEQSYGADNPNVARDLNNLAMLLEGTNRLGEAEPMLRRALMIDEQSFGPDHPNVARDLNNLAVLLKDTNRLGDAEPMLRRALMIDEQSFGPDHPNVAIRLNNLAMLLHATNRLGDAEPMLRRALEIDEQSFGDDHPKIAIRLNNLALLLEGTNRLGEAEPILRRALAIDEQSFGANHPNVARDLNNLAVLLKDTNRFEEADPMLRRALTIDEKSFGADHPKVAIRLNNLAQLLKATNRLGEAEPLMRRNLEILCRFTQSTGHGHPRLKAAIGNYWELLAAMQLPEPERVQRLIAAGVEKEWLSDG